MGFKITQWGYGKGVEETPLYVTTMTLENLNKAEMDRWNRKNKEGYQRQVRPSRFTESGKNSVVSYLLNELGVFPTSVLLNIRNKIDFKETNSIDEKMSFGEISFDDEETLYIIDGQHRIYALKQAQMHHPELEEYPLPVTIMNLKDRFDEMLNFFIVNSRQYKIPTDLAFRHMQNMKYKANLENKKWLEHAILGEKENRAAIATIIVDYLEEDTESPFYGKIQFAGEDRQDWHLVRDYSLSSWFTKILSEKTFALMPEMRLAELIADYWSAIKELYPIAFEDPKNYSLLKSTGLASLTYLFPSIYAMSANDGQTNKERFKYYLSKLKEEISTNEADNAGISMDFRTPINDKWWSQSSGPAIASATGNKMSMEVARNFAKKINLKR